jgi:phosphoglycolate phosphatase-like HAD superfamily hydrolase
MKLFVWDFHGVLEQDNDLAVLFITNKVLKEFGYKKRINKKITNELYGQKWHKYFEHLLPGETKERCFELANRCFEIGKNNLNIISKYIKVTPNAKNVLEQIDQKHDQILISNTNKQSLKKFLKIVGLDTFWKKNKIFSTDSCLTHLKTNKNKIVSNYIKDKEYSEIIVIGDSIEEMNLAKDLESKFYLYAHKNKKMKEGNYGKKIRDLRKILIEI